MASYDKLLTRLQDAALKYRKDIQPNKMYQMAKVCSDSLKSVPDDKLDLVFEEAFRNCQYFPTDKQLLKAWYTIRNTSEASNGFYDSFGTWVREGTYYTGLNCPTGDFYLQAISREIDLRLRATSDQLRDLDLEEYEILKSKVFIPIKGQIQKPAHEWNRDDHDFQDRFCDDLNKRINAGIEYKQKISQNSTKEKRN